MKRYLDLRWRGLLAINANLDRDLGIGVRSGGRDQQQQQQQREEQQRLAHDGTHTRTQTRCTQHREENEMLNGR